MIDLGELLHFVDGDVLLRDGFLGDDHCDRGIAVDTVHVRNGADDIARTHQVDPLSPRDDHVRNLLPASSYHTNPPSLCLPGAACTMALIIFVCLNIQQHYSSSSARSWHAWQKAQMAEKTQHARGLANLYAAGAPTITTPITPLGFPFATLHFISPAVFHPSYRRHGDFAELHPPVFLPVFS